MCSGFLVFSHLVEKKRFSLLSPVWSKKSKTNWQEIQIKSVTQAIYKRWTSPPWCCPLPKITRVPIWSFWWCYSAWYFEDNHLQTHVACPAHFFIISKIKCIFYSVRPGSSDWHHKLTWKLFIKLSDWLNAELVLYYILIYEFCGLPSLWFIPWVYARFLLEIRFLISL